MKSRLGLTSVFGVLSIAFLTPGPAFAGTGNAAVGGSGYGYAQYRDYQRHWDSSREKRYAYRVGYLRGYKTARKGVYYDRDRAPEYRGGVTGYLSWMGERDDYRDSFRRGFSEGWRDGRDNRARRYGRRDIEEVLGAPIDRVYERDWRLYNERERDDDQDRDYDRDRNQDQYRDNDRDRNHRYDRDFVARAGRERGYNDGLQAGREDREHHRRYDFDDHGSWKDGTNGYRDEYGDKDWYRRAYREGFQNGYEQGYRYHR